ncbi:hypothetical protein [Pseudomonas sp. TAE6080]|uniref:hypothetical protein n=1 Tax=Pseudomonas sp. TAE6080 TaxID=2840374 RepID=UPI001C00262F|nr:hypothetical protein [Pseudomonas sp. TAE6080]MBT9303276.1 hypothetical protein [Pseudomonas sp. TAE6080]
MIDLTELKSRAEALIGRDDIRLAPDVILALIAENERLTNRLEVDPRHDYDGISTRDATVKVLDEQVDQLKAENEQLKAENERLSTENSEIESAAITYIEDMQEAQRENARLTELLTVGMTLDGNLRVYGDWQSVRKAQEILAERDQLRAEIAGLKTGYEAYEQVNAELKAENERLERNRDMWKGQVERQAEELTALREEVTEWKDTVKFNEGCWSEERGTMIDKLQESRMRIKELDLLFGRHILAMRSALIEEEHGKGPAAAMEWIYNSLAGPGELPPEGETDSQAYFDREIVAVDNGMQDVMAFHEGRRAAMGKGEQS